jgi:DNA repair exonuclease SbcCD ATPase subunit
MSELHDEHDDELLDLEQPPSAEELQDQVKRAQAELLQLRQKQEQIEKEKQRLEDLTRRQDELEKGRNEITDKLNRALVLVQRETEESQRRLEQLNTIQDSFAEHLRNLADIDPRSWNGRDLPRELTRALGTVDEARSAYARSHAKITPVASGDESQDVSGSLLHDAEDPGFAYWLRNGVAFTLPIIVLGSVALILWIWHLATAAR